MTAQPLVLQPTPSAAAGFGPTLDAALADLAAGPERLRVWSLVVTIFGDAAAPRGGALRLGAVQEVAARLGVEAGALRTAMSRLARDGWLARDRRGRASFYSLTAARQAELAAATRRIYAPGPPDWDGGWRLAVAPAAAGPALRAEGYAAAAPGLWLRPGRPGEGAGAAPPGASLFRVPAGAAEVSPALIAAAWPEAAAAARFRALIDRLRPLEGAAAPAPLDALAARVLTLHLWRRAVLAAADLPLALRGPDWPGEAARAAVRALYWRLAGPAEAWLDRCDGGPEGALPPPGPGFAARFGGPPRAEP
jgi:phenylacetic acid degradation operon negative regulatory protein